jgi:hypothetical protein
VDLITTRILVAHGQLVEFSGDVVRRPDVHVLVGVHTIGSRSTGRVLVLSNAGEGGVKALVRAKYGVTFLARQLAHRAITGAGASAGSLTPSRTPTTAAASTTATTAIARATAS